MAGDNSALVHIGMKGTVFALDRRTGQTVWKQKLKGSDFVNLLLDGEDLFATTRGEVFCLDAYSGAIRWNNTMPGSGFGLAAIATPSGSSTAAVAEYLREEAARAAQSSSPPPTVP